MILPDTRYRKVVVGDEVAQEKHKPNPIEFKNGRYQTDDEVEQEIIESQDDFGETLQNANIAPAPEERGFDADTAQEQANEPTLEEKLDAADSLEERKQILRDAGQEALAEQLGAAANGESGGETSTVEPSTEEGVPSKDELEVIDGVSNKSDALDALDSIEQANDDVDFDVNTSDNVDTIAAAAKREGYTFADWP